ncbi:MAG: 50S ribosomal protein L10 [Clostridia bacterium]|nr:50S ribosomal protein L10 [Clostridia bacterium]
MPSVKVLEEKKAQVAALKERLGAAVAGVVVDYKGTTVEDDTKLRKELREAGVEYSVAKNTLIRLAINGTALAAMDDILNGTTALATSREDYVAAAKILSKFAEGHENFTLKAGFIDGELITLEKLNELAKLPSKEQLLANVCMVFQAPMASFARAIQAIVDKGGADAAEAPAEDAASTEEAAPAEDAAPAEAPAEEAAPAEEPAE